ncbi:Uncharacterized protein dnm_073790 [Desulfonema magnum]|uniref:Uncharacterized protein n=1 Tax=Desulfonema magnum TaxID=45655 RepID=A0A975BUD3_9BACT|nr:Uncharacterized protein dnm_073790 [Desulfonema magnum]
MNIEFMQSLLSEAYFGHPLNLADESFTLLMREKYKKGV